MAGLLTERITDHAARAPGRVALRSAGGDLDYAGLDSLAGRLAAALAAEGVGAGDRVAVRLGKSAGAVALFLAVLRLGAVHVPLNPDFTMREAGAILSDAGPALVVTDTAGAGPLSSALPGLRVRDLARLRQAAETLAPVSGPGLTPDMPAAMLFTSGTTGRPKGAVLSHGNIAANLAALNGVWGITDTDTILHVLPAFHAHGLFLGIGCLLMAGGAAILLDGFDADRVAARLPEATVFMAVPAIYTRLLAHPGFDRAACRNLRLLTSGSAPLPAEVFAAIEARAGLAPVERYGLTETIILTSNPLRGPRRPGTVGLPLPGVDLRLADARDGVGRVEVRGPSVARDYWRAGPVVGPDGWFDTGDLGRLDAGGYLVLVGRSKDLIISGGYNVYPREVETVLEAMAGVEEAAVFGVPHPGFGEAVVAAVRGTAPEAELRAGLAAALAPYKRPKAILILDALPKNALGKVLRTELRAAHAGLFGGEGGGEVVR
ncbi:MAG: AMP-binding protein [Gemmobacter sp.]